MCHNHHNHGLCLISCRVSDKTHTHGSTTWFTSVYDHCIGTQYCPFNGSKVPNTEYAFGLPRQIGLQYCTLSSVWSCCRDMAGHRALSLFLIPPRVTKKDIVGEKKVQKQNERIIQLGALKGKYGCPAGQIHTVPQRNIALWVPVALLTLLLHRQMDMHQ